NARQALKLAHRGYVLETGRLVLAGTATQLASDPKVKEAYLGRINFLAACRRATKNCLLAPLDCQIQRIAAQFSRFQPGFGNPGKQFASLRQTARQTVKIIVLRAPCARKS
ncbi:MAG: hypothetical protein Q7U34_10170, partial [Anaerolineales bacterium]|nr:hypothetical protein [Anaerolineales bacterium]